MRLPRSAFLLVLLATSVAGGGVAWLRSGSKAADAPVIYQPERVHPVQIARGVQPQAATGLHTYHGDEAKVSCMTCHTTRAPNLNHGLDGSLPTEFHPNLQYAHGGLSCVSCHDPRNYDVLRRADGRTTAFPDARQLCSQCHGPQTRDYERGSHGGMRGYWDLSRGERTRNTCIDCHDPHAPAYPTLMPVFPPQDAGARQQAARAAHPGHD